MRTITRLSLLITIILLPTAISIGLYGAGSIEFLWLPLSLIFSLTIAIATRDPRAVGEAQMDIDALQVIAETTGGSFFAAEDREQLEDIYRQIDALTPEEIATTSYRPTRLLFHWPLGILVALVLFYHLLMGMGAALRHSRARHA